MIQSNKIVLCSGSPRRQELLKNIVRDFSTLVIDVDETVDSFITPEKTAEAIAIKKAKGYQSQLSDGQIGLSSDTVVILNKEIMGKPEDSQVALKMLRKLSGTVHFVDTAVVLFNNKHLLDSRTKRTKVWFKELTESEIQFYVTNFNPIDKAGAYGIQEYLGYIGVEKIEGCHYNVIGLPVSMVYEMLLFQVPNQ